MILVLDQGTTSTRALRLQDDTLVPCFGAEHRQILPAPGRVEHDPAEILRNLRAALDTTPGAEIGLANQGESCLGWDDATGEPVSPIIVWQDLRTAPALAAMGEVAAEVRARAGLPLDPYFSAAKLGWIAARPEARALGPRLRLGTTDAWFRRMLFGRAATDPTTASRTSLMNLATLDWDDELCRIFGVPRWALPPIEPSTGDLSGALRASLTDQQAALYGHDCRRAGEAKITLGTGGFLLAVTDRPVIGAGPVPTVAWAKAGMAPAFALDAGVTTAAAAVNWARGLGLFREHSEISSFDAAPAIDRGLAFVPALAGLGCPHWDRDARAGWSGLTLDTGPRDMMQALLEGIAFRIAEAAASVAAQQPLSRISVDGGLARNPYLLQVLADALDRDLLLPAEVEQTARGLALMVAETLGAPPPPPGQQRRVIPCDPKPERLARFARAREGLVSAAKG
ncbi:FGGY family carbohydrate kinase [Frigidibacter sp. MR17.14]|uniref:FGGY family carbohydrate kinase n=1 Tax=Frigidibacter sp. MR17.14 TaxID=3126509 RepID=UPI003012A7D8